MVRLKDIAEKTGYSVNTVSLALRDSARLSKETRQKIQEIAKKLNYRPNQIAKSLVSRQSNIIGLIVTDIRNPVLTHVAQAVEKELAAKKYGVLFGTSNDDIEIEKQVVEMFRARQVDGILAYPKSQQHMEHLYSLREEGFPIVSLVKDPLGKVDVVSVDDEVGAILATEHLIEQGHTKIGLVDTLSPMGNKDKYNGYKKTMEAHNLKPIFGLNEDLNCHTLARGYKAMEKIMSQDEKPTAIFAVIDNFALGVLRWAAKNNVNIPNDIALVGFDNIEYGEYASVPISSMNYDVDKVSKLAVARLVELIAAGNLLPEPRTTLIKPELVIRQSSVAAT